MKQHKNFITQFLTKLNIELCWNLASWTIQPGWKYKKYHLIIMIIRPAYSFVVSVVEH